MGTLMWIHLQGGLLLAVLVTARPSLRRPVWVLAAAGAAWLPLADGSDLAGWLYAYSDQLSLPSLALLLGLLARRCGAPLPAEAGDTRLFFAPTLVLALGLYPPALGLGPWDPYALGFGPWALPLVTLTLAGLAALRGHWPPAWTLVAAVAAWLGGIAESVNLWDYLTDPWLGMAALAWMVRKWQRKNLRSTV